MLSSAQPQVNLRGDALAMETPQPPVQAEVTEDETANVAFQESAMLGEKNVESQAKLSVILGKENVEPQMKLSVILGKGNVEPQVKLSTIRFLAFVVGCVGVLIAFMVVFLSDVSIGGKASDPIGSSANADKEVENYQLLNGYVAAAGGEIINEFFAICITVMITYLGNLSWHSGQDPRDGRSPVKTAVLGCVMPVMFYVLNIGITSMNIKHTIVGVEHVFVEGDLLATSYAVGANDSISDVQNTILKTTVLNSVKPYTIASDSNCFLGKDSTPDAGSIAERNAMPTVTSIDSTSVVFGFPANSWNYNALPTAASPTHSVNFSLNDFSVDDFTAFQATTGFDFLTGYEMYLQGKALLERSVSDGNVEATYPCSWVDGKSEDNPNDEFSIFDNSSEYEGMRMCSGAVSSLQKLANMTNESTHNLQTFVETIVQGLYDTLDYISTNEVQVVLETYTLSSQLNMTAMTIDIPLETTVRYRNMTEACTADREVVFLVNNTDGYTQDEIDWFNEYYCTETYYVYESPATTCGTDNCIFLDKSGITPLKKQVLLLPYLKDCSVEDMQYSSDYLNFLPSGCVAEEDSVFLYGSGAYMEGDAFIEEDLIPYLVNTRRHLVLSFAKLDWQLTDVSKVFNADCGVPGGCSGLVHKLENATAADSKTASVLVVGNSTIPADRMEARFINPVHLVTLNAQPLYYPTAGASYVWEYLDKTRFGDVSWSEPLMESNCSILVDSYIKQVEANHFYLDEPLQAMYTSALYYLFQDAATKTVTLDEAPEGATSLYMGSARFDGDTERKNIKYSIPLSSAIATATGVAILIGFAFLVVAVPMERVKKSTETNFAARYAAILTEENYLPEVHDINLKLPTGELLKMDYYTVKAMTLHFRRNEQEKAHL
ncbi:hypothetical protein BBJ28_00009779 [Nothophytophthora sp. Chile5]|nr:hypothetical protein BBJ28_00009779 [Nothophytophthora sp. Chile5]